ncbi:hypothetical protein G6F58_013386 [Rhizopus delemar]|nr:hypothetical protein G6F58_013386 [Rhizopus delemar]
MAPFRLQASAQTVRPSIFSTSGRRAPVSAICGTSRGETKLPTSISRKPASAIWRIQRSLSAAGIMPLAICSPSRGPTSQSLPSGFMCSPVVYPSLWQPIAAPRCRRS